MEFLFVSYNYGKFNWKKKKIIDVLKKVLGRLGLLYIDNFHI